MVSARELNWLRQAARQSKVPLTDLVQRRLKNEPLQYIIGTQPFGSLDLLVRQPVLIPRPETEDWTIRLAELLLKSDLSRPRSLLDIGTGTGCIPLLLCHMLPQGSLQAHGLDISSTALALAAENARRHNIPEPSEAKSNQNTFIGHLDDLFSSTFLQKSNEIQPPFDILTSNPPYIAWDEREQLPESVSKFEDPRALYGGKFGLDFYDEIARRISAPGFLRSGAIVALEVGHTQASYVQQMLCTLGGLRDVTVWLDPWRKDRTVVGYK